MFEEGRELQVGIPKSDTRVSKFGVDVPLFDCSAFNLLDGTRDLGIGTKFCCSLIDLFDVGLEAGLGAGFTKFGCSCNNLLDEGREVGIGVGKLGFIDVFDEGRGVGVGRSS